MSRGYQIPLIEVDPLIKLSEVERALSKIFYPAPSRPTIVGWLQQGYCDFFAVKILFEGSQLGNGENWFVYKTSLDRLIYQSQSGYQKLAA